MKKIFTILLAIGTSLNFFAQFTIQGNLTDENGYVLPYVPVYLMPANLSIETDESGKFEFLNIQPGKYYLQVSHIGYLDNETEIFVLADQQVDIVMGKKSIRLNEIYINGTRTDDKMPFTYKNFDRETIESNNFGEDIPYLLGQSPSVVSTSDGGSGIGYTGIRIRGSDATRINVTLNDIPINDSESQQVYWVDLPDLAASTESVQIQRGVGTSTNGAGAFGASINILTGQFHPEAYLSVDGSYGSYNSRKLSAKAGTGLMNDRFTIDLRYSLIGSDGYIDRAEASMNSFFLSAASIGQSSSLRFNAIFGKETTYQAWDGVPVQYAFTDSLRRFNVQGTDYFQLDPPYENQIDDYTQNHFQLFYNSSLSDKLALNFAGHYTRGYGFYEQYKVDENLIDYKLDTLKVQKSDLVRQKWLSNYFFGGIYNLKLLLNNSSIIFGGAVNRYIGDHYGVVRTILKIPAYANDDIYYENQGKKTDFNTYFKFLYTFGKRLNSFVDLQYRFISYSIKGDDDDARSHQIKDKIHFFNPKAGVNLKLSRSFTVYSSFSVSNKEPNRVDYINASENKIPKPETLYDLESGIRYNTSKFNLQTNFYYMNYKNQLALTGKLDNVGNAIRENVNKSYRMGLENDFMIKVKDYLNINANITLSRNKIEEFKELIPVWDLPYEPIELIHKNKNISYSPEVIAGGGFSFDFLKFTGIKSGKSLILSASEKFVGKQYLDNTQNEVASIDPYYFTDIALAYKMSNKVLDGLEIAFKIGNLFDQRYVSNGYAYQYSSAAYDPRPDDPYSIKNQGDFYYGIGLFPQALRNFMIRLRIDLQ